MKPIGIFDSGIGGLTVARAIAESLPGSPIVYFGDTAHLPYGEKSGDLIRRYASRITEELLTMGCGAIVIACNSASTNALEVVREVAGPEVPVIDVVSPVVHQVASTFQEGRIGIIGTRATIASGWYQRLLEAEGFEVVAKATPLLASAIEEGFHEGSVSSALVEAYLGGTEFSEIDALILGCTHYPLIAEQIAAQLPDGVKIIDSATAVAVSLRNSMSSGPVAEQQTTTFTQVDQRFLVSDLTQSFARGAQRFFGDRIELEERKLWGTNP
jgi:glutamate racemase